MSIPVFGAADARPAKRARTDLGDTEYGASKTVELRKDACSRLPELCAQAQTAISLQLRCGECCKLASFSPSFTHQLFPEENVYGYANPRVCVEYSEPSLAMSLTGRSAPPDTKAVDAAALGVPQDDIRKSLKLGISDALSDALAMAADGVHASEPFSPLDIRAAEREPPTVTMPPGVCVSRYERAEGTNLAGAASAASGASLSQSRKFVIHRWRPADDPALVALHDRMGTLATWLIETASPIDATDPKWTVYGAWEVLEHSASGSDGTAASETPAVALAAADAVGRGTPSHVHFVGYATTYLFTNPFAKGGRPNTLRLAQLVVLPPYQRQQHGLRLLAAIHRDAHGSGAHAIGHKCASDSACAVDVAADPSTASSGAGAHVAAATSSSAEAAHAGADAHAAAPPLGLDAAEVSVEAPCEGMRALRDCYDTAHAAAAGIFDERLGPVHALMQLPPALRESFASYGRPAAGAVAASSASADSEAGAGAAVAAIAAARPQPHLAGDSIASLDAPPPLAPLSAAAGRRVLRTPTAQVHRAFEALLLARIDRSDGESMRRFRLAVKRRLFETDEDVAAVTDTSRRKALLDLLFNACLADYARTLGTLRAIPREEASALHADAAAAVKRLEAELEQQSEDGGDD